MRWEACLATDYRGATLPAGHAQGGGADVGTRQLLAHAPGRAGCAGGALDLRMPDIDGLEVLERLRELDPPPACRVLLVSASLDEEVERAADAAGAAGCIGKDSPRADICAEALRLARQ